MKKQAKTRQVKTRQINKKPTTNSRNKKQISPKAPKSVAARPTAVKATNPPDASDWRGHMLARVRALIKQASPDITEEVKWRKPSNGMLGVPVWSLGGIICTGETYKAAVKLTFAKGAALDDPAGLFNASLEGNTRRAIDLHEGDSINAEAFKSLIRAAVALNTASAAPQPSLKRPKAT